MNMQVSASQFKIWTTNSAVVEIETDLRVTGDASKPIIAGEIRTEAGRLEVDQILEQLARNPYRTEATMATATETERTAEAGSSGRCDPHSVSMTRRRSTFTWCSPTTSCFAAVTCTPAFRASASAT